MRKAVFLGMAAALVCAAGCGGSSSTTTSSGGYSATTLHFRSDGTPDLKGLTLHMGNAAGDATIGDTVVYMLVQQLKNRIEALRLDGVWRDLGVHLIPGEVPAPLPQVDERLEGVVEFQFHSNPPPWRNPFAFRRALVSHARLDQGDWTIDRTPAPCPSPGSDATNSDALRRSRPPATDPLTADAARRADRPGSG